MWLGPFASGNKSVYIFVAQSNVIHVLWRCIYLCLCVCLYVGFVVKCTAQRYWCCYYCVCSYGDVCMYYYTYLYTIHAHARAHKNNHFRANCTRVDFFLPFAFCINNSILMANALAYIFPQEYTEAATKIRRFRIANARSRASHQKSLMRARVQFCAWQTFHANTTPVTAAAAAYSQNLYISRIDIRT